MNKDKAAERGSRPLRKRMRESESTYRSLFEGAGDSIFILEAEGPNAGRIVDANEAAAKMHGYTLDELRSLNITDLDAPDAAGEAAERIKRILGGERIKDRINHVRKDGTIFQVEVNAGVLLIEGHKYILAVDRDITDRVKAERDLRAALDKAENERNRNEAMIAAMGDGISIQDTDFKVLYQNQVHKELIGDHLAEYCYAAYERKKRVCEGCGVAQAFKDGAVHKCERSVMTDRGLFHVEITASPVRDAEGRIIAGVEIVRDISQRKNMELVLLRTNRALRTLSRCNEKMVRAHNELELLRDICEVIVTEGGYRLAWVGYAEDDEAKTVRPAQQYGYEEGYLEAVRVSWANTKLGRGPVGTAIRNAAPCVIKDVHNDRSFAPWKEEALKREYSSVVGLPLIMDDGTRGALAIYSADPDAFDDQEIGLLSDLADDLAFGVSSLRTRAARDAAETERQKLTARRREAEEEKQRSNDVNMVVSLLLKMTLDGSPVDLIFDRALSLVLSVKWLSLEPKGAIFLKDESSDTLTMIAQKGLSNYLLRECRKIPVGKCLCGKAAAHREVLFCDNLDHRHEISYEGMEPHGHYCVPILLSGETLGVMNAYTERGHKYGKKEVEFLQTVAGVLAGIIHRRRIEREREVLIDDLREALGKISRSKQEWQETFDSITDLISIHDANFNIVKANRAFANYFGFEPKDVIRKKCHELFHGADSRSMYCPHVLSMNNKMPAKEEYFDPRTNKTFAILTFPYFSPGGNVVGTIHIARDITAEREKEMRLIMSERLASLGQMASGIAHEINNPLASISGCAEGMLDSVVKGKCDTILFERYLKIILEEIARCKNITTSMLSFVRKTSDVRQDVNINDLLSKAIEMIGFQGRLLEVEVVSRLEEDIPYVRGNENELRQVFISIITNALDSMESRGALTIVTGSGEGTVFAEIEDTGQGISSEHLYRIFDPFFTTKSIRGGTGLGLSIAKKIIDDHNGDISVESEEGKGTTFKISLPRA